MPNYRFGCEPKALQKTVECQGYKCYEVAITLTFKETIDHHHGIYILCNRIKECFSNSIKLYCFYPEYGNNHNFHFHGKVLYTNKVHFSSFVSLWRKSYGFVKVVPIRNDKERMKWHIYCLKDSYLWKNLRIHGLNIDRRSIQSLVKIYLGAGKYTQELCPEIENHWSEDEGDESVIAGVSPISE